LRQVRKDLTEEASRAGEVFDPSVLETRYWNY
jgi:hypothetical protein